jgi:hypothetical protein
MFFYLVKRREAEIKHPRKKRLVSKRASPGRRWLFQNDAKKQNALTEITTSITRTRIAFIDKLEKRMKANKNVLFRPSLLTRDPRTKSRTGTLRSTVPTASTPAAPALPEALGTHPTFATILT